MTNLMRELRRIKDDNARRLSIIDYDMKKLKKKAGIAEKGPAPEEKQEKPEVQTGKRGNTVCKSCRAANKQKNAVNEVKRPEL